MYRVDFINKGTKRQEVRRMMSLKINGNQQIYVSAVRNLYYNLYVVYSKNDKMGELL